MRTFEMFRGHDESGVSGEGRVLEGVVFSDGPCVVRWTTELNGRSEARYDSFASFTNIHVTSHPSNQTKIVFSDGEVYEQKANGTIPKTRKKRKDKLPSKGVEGQPIPDGVRKDEHMGEKVPQSQSKEA